MASREVFFSFNFFVFYGAVLALLFIYALLWQQILKSIPLSSAYLNKAIVVIWGMVWGAIFFGEKIKWNMILGAVIIIIGILVVVKDNG